jgi:anti-sigma factor RsiW
MRCEEAQELITARIDGELAADEQVAIDAHLNVCELCRRALAAESRLKQRLKSAGRDIAAPAELRRTIEQKLPARQSAAGNASSQRGWRWPNSLGWRPVFASAVLLLVFAGLIYTRWPRQNIGLAALETHASVLSGKTLAPADNPTTLRDELARAVAGRFRPVALDLSLMKLYPVSGFVQRIGDRDVLVTVYQGDGPAVTCFTFLGSEADAPDDAEPFFDADMHVNFYSFSRAGVNGLLHREADVICVLASKMRAADLLALIRGKSTHG